MSETLTRKLSGCVGLEGEEKREWLLSGYGVSLGGNESGLELRSGNLGTL